MLTEEHFKLQLLVGARIFFIFLNNLVVYRSSANIYIFCASSLALLDRFIGKSMLIKLGYSFLGQLNERCPTYFDF